MPRRRAERKPVPPAAGSPKVQRQHRDSAPRSAAPHPSAPGGSGEATEAAPSKAKGPTLNCRQVHKAFVIQRDSAARGGDRELIAPVTPVEGD